MAIHFSTFVIPRTLIEHQLDTPVLALGADTEPEIADLPLVTSLHRIGHEVMPLVHAAFAGAAGVTVNDAWIDAATKYEGAKVALVLEPIPADIASTWAPAETGVDGTDLPPWVGQLVLGRLHMAIRDVVVTAGQGVGDLGMDPTVSTASVESWAHQIIRPEDG